MANISVRFSDGSVITLDKTRRQLFITLKDGAGVIKCNDIPARPNPPTVFKVQGSAHEESETIPSGIESKPIEQTCSVRKLGYKKIPIINQPVWNSRVLKLEFGEISYYKNDGNESTPPQGIIDLNSHCTTRVIHAKDPARADRYEDNDAGALMQQMKPGQPLPIYTSPIGLDNCVELHIPAKIENPGSANPQVQRSRTFYFAFETNGQAIRFSEAIQHNIELIQKAEQNAIEIAKSIASPGFGGSSSSNGNGGGFGAAAAAAAKGSTNQSINSPEANKLKSSPHTSLQWFKAALWNSTLSDEALYETLANFYTQMAKEGVYSSY